MDCIFSLPSECLNFFWGHNAINFASLFFYPSWHIRHALVSFLYPNIHASYRVSRLRVDERSHSHIHTQSHRHTHTGTRTHTDKHTRQLSFSCCTKYAVNDRFVVLNITEVHFSASAKQNSFTKLSKTGVLIQPSTQLLCLSKGQQGLRHNYTNSLRRINQNLPNPSLRIPLLTFFHWAPSNGAVNSFQEQCMSWNRFVIPIWQMSCFSLTLLWALFTSLTK